MSWAGIALLASEARSTRIYDQHFEAVHQIFARQNRLQAALGVLDPTLAIRAASMSFAGTDETEQQAFAQAAEAYRQHFVTMMNSDLAAHGRKDGSPYVADRELFERVPPFAYQPPSAVQTLAHQWTNLLSLFVAAIVSLRAFLQSLGKLRPNR